ncbi:MAG: TIR domain-containing protein [Firmicutes bacterium]|nr:TIR domain-containing protein [Bacillota bacterium]
MSKQVVLSYKCGSCGANLQRTSDIYMMYKCDYCQSEQKIYEWGDETGRLLDKALALRLSFSYDIAKDIYMDIISRFPDCIDAYWGALLSSYGVEISERTQYRPTLHKIRLTRFTDEPLYRQFLSHPKIDHIAAVGYRKMADEIDQVRGEAIAATRNQPAYDVFLSFKNQDENGALTKDRIFAEKIYKQLVKRGYKVFFAPETLKGKAGLAYEPIIYAALNTASSMILIASREEYINSPWVANEWQRYKEIIAENRRSAGIREMRLIICYSGQLTLKTLPGDLARYQNLNMNEPGSEKMLLSFFSPRRQTQAAGASPALNNYRIVTYDDGRRYEGEFLGKKKHGQGKFYFTNGDRYEGEFKDDRTNGQGKYFWVDGNRYEGEFKNDIKHGQGIYYFSNGSRYEGGIAEDKINGFGIYYNAKGEVMNKGMWKDGIFIK